MDDADKGLYKAYTGGEKYFLLKNFLLPTGIDPDNSGDDNNQGSQGNQGQGQGQAKKDTTSKSTVQEIPPSSDQGTPEPEEETDQRKMPITPGMITQIEKQADRSNISLDMIKGEFGIKDITELDMKQVNDVLKFVKDSKK